MKIESILMILIIVLTCSIIYNTKLIIDNNELRTAIAQSNNNCQQRIESYQIYEGVPQNTSWGVNGLYWSNKGYYCVNVKNNDNITRTEIHEQCHALIKGYGNNTSQRKHFCEDW